MQSNPIRRFQVLPNFGVGHIVSWEIDPTYDLGVGYRFVVEVGDSPTFNSDLAYTLDAGKNLYVLDDTRDKQSWSYDRYYRLRLELESETFYSRPIMFGQGKETVHAYLRAAEIIRKELLRMRRFTGQSGWLLKRKAQGKVSSTYVDEVSGVPIADTKVEYGVGLDGGYYPPIAMYYTYEEMNQRKSLQQGGYGTVEDITVKFRTIGFPIVEVRDILVSKETDSRYNVLAVDVFSFPGTNIPIVQTLSAKRLPPTDTIYNITLPLTHEFVIP